MTGSPGSCDPGGTTGAAPAVNRPAPASPRSATPKPRRTGALGHDRDTWGAETGAGSAGVCGGGVAARVCCADAGVRRRDGAGVRFFGVDVRAGVAEAERPVAVFGAAAFLADTFLVAVFFAGGLAAERVADGVDFLGARRADDFLVADLGAAFLPALAVEPELLRAELLGRERAALTGGTPKSR